MAQALIDSHVANLLASDWMHQGMDLAKENSATTLERAVRCFDEAIALRRGLPLEENHFYRYGLSAGWINRGDALARLGGNLSLVEAVKSYDEALLLLETLPLEENVLYPRRLAITWINRGMALQKQETPNSSWEAAECFREAIRVSEESFATTMADRPSLLAGAWINLAGALMDSNEDEDVRSAAQQALGWVRFSERKDIVSAEVGLKARHLLCRLTVKRLLEKKAVSKAVMAEAVTAVDEALALVRHWNRQGPTEFAQLARDLFRFGCRIYESDQPHSLADFLLAALEPETLDVPFLFDHESFAAAQAAIWSALEKLQPEGFQFVATPGLQSFLRDVEQLRKVEERLLQLRAGWNAAGKCGVLTSTTDRQK